MGGYGRLFISRQGPLCGPLERGAFGRVAMPVGALQRAKRAFVGVLRSLATAYGITVEVTRDSEDAAVTRAYKRVLLKVHPDKGGTEEDAKRLNAAKEKWDSAKEKAAHEGAGTAAPPRAPGPAPPAGPPTRGVQVVTPASAGRPATEYRVRGLGVLLTYAGVADVAQWRRFVAHVKSKRRAWCVKHWCTTLEASKEGSLHVHLMVQFTSSVDMTTKRFLFESLVPARQRAHVAQTK